MRRSGWLVVALGAVLVAGPLIDYAVAKKPKSRLSALVNDKKLKASKRGLLGIYSTTSFSVAGATKARRGVVRTATVNCGPVDVRTVAPPIALTGCFGSYTEAGKRSSFRQWTGAGMELTVDSVDGNRISGTFRGILVDASSANPSDASTETEIEEGSFSIVLTDIGV